MGLFKIENGLLVLDKEELRGISEFHKILVRDKGSDGDHDGRKKLLAFKEFWYIWYKSDLESPGNKQGMDEPTLRINGKKEARLPEDWKEDNVVVAACKKYKEIYVDVIPELVLLNAQLRALNLSSKMTDSIVSSLEVLHSTYEKKMADAAEKGIIINITESLGDINSIQSGVEQLLKMASKIPDNIANLEKTREAVVKAKSGSNLIRGKHEKGNRADPT